MFPQILLCDQNPIYFVTSEYFPQDVGSLKPPHSIGDHIICTVDGNGGVTFFKLSSSFEYRIVYRETAYRNGTTSGRAWPKHQKSPYL